MFEMVDIEAHRAKNRVNNANYRKHNRVAYNIVRKRYKDKLRKERRCINCSGDLTPEENITCQNCGGGMIKEFAYAKSCQKSSKKL